MVHLTEDERIWLQVNYPQLNYDEERSIINGTFPINHTYRGCTIKDKFEILIPLWQMRNRNEYPVVFNTDGRINNIAKRKKIDCIDLHIGENKRLCLGLPERFEEYYPSGFDIQTFCKHLSEHLYWVSYFERYNKEPWPAELHGNCAKIEFLIEKQEIEGLRKLYKQITGRGIAKQKLRNYLCSAKLTNSLKNKLFKYERCNKNSI